MNKLYERVANLLLDRFCEVESPNDCLKYLLSAHFTKEELLKLCFSAEDIDNAIEEMKEEEKQNNK